MAMIHGPWAMAMVHGPWPMAYVPGNGPPAMAIWPWAMAIAMAMARPMGQGGVGGGADAVRRVAAIMVGGRRGGDPTDQVDQTKLLCQSDGCFDRTN